MKLDIKPGTICTITYVRPIKLKKAFKGKYALLERTFQGQYGVSYDNTKKVIEKRENGELPKENAGLPYGEWEEYPFTIKHDGKIYHRFNIIKSTVPEENLYFLDGKLVNRADLVPLCYSTELNEKNEMIRNLTVDQITHIAHGQ